ncbi:hypothetical protein L3V82_00065 [Thiotrichales bacterium 19S3-7]|nr:hypothetical protein [Thiotrichales bacterium 19S3-7]MCF6800561.1 hypothetical protein [Thiotrichales bacterium 19S3-11]
MRRLSKFISGIVVVCMLAIASMSYADVNSAIQVFNQTHQQPSQSEMLN